MLVVTVAMEVVTCSGSRNLEKVISDFIALLCPVVFIIGLALTLESSNSYKCALWHVNLLQMYTKSNFILNITFAGKPTNDPLYW